MCGDHDVWIRFYEVRKLYKLRVDILRKDGVDVKYDLYAIYREAMEKETQNA